MKGNMEERAKNLAEYIIEHETTVRKAAENFGVSKKANRTFTPYREIRCIFCGI